MKMRTPSIARLLILVIFIYLVAWTLIYTIVMGSDFSYYFTYLYLGWAGGGEIPTLITMYAVIATLFVAGGARVFSWAWRKNK